MPIYSKASAQMVYDLLNEANPGSGFTVSAANATLGVPATATVPGKPLLNTSVPLSAVPNGDFIGRGTYYYRRIDFSYLMRGVLVQVNKYSPTQSAATSVVFTVYQLLPAINAQYGLNLTSDDINDANILRGNTLEDGFYTTTVTITAKATSLGFTGSFAFKWKSAPQDLESMILVTDLSARLFPGGNDFSGAHKVIVNQIDFGTDWTAWLAANPWPSNYPASVGPGNAPAYTTWFAKYLAVINAEYGLALTATWGTDVAFGDPAGNVGSRVLTLPHPSYPELNSKYFNRCLTIPVLDASTKMAGTFFLHFNG